MSSVIVTEFKIVLNVFISVWRKDKFSFWNFVSDLIFRSAWKFRKIKQEIEKDNAWKCLTGKFTSNRHPFPKHFVGFTLDLLSGKSELQNHLAVL